MTSSTPKKGYDSWVDNSHVNATNGSDLWLQVYNGQKRTLLWMPMPDRIKGRNVSSATLTGHAHGAMAAQTFTITPVVAQWEAGKVTWTNQPALVSSPPTATAVLGSAIADGDEIVWDATTLLQAIANGTLKNFGWKITTSLASLSKFAAFNSGVDAWTLDVEWDEDPDAPSVLAPDGTVVSVAKPVVTFDFTEYGADPTDLAEIRVEVDTNGDGTVDWNSGFVVPSPVAPMMDLAAQGMTGTITSGQTVKWRSYVEDTSGNPSVASDWATYTYRPLGSLTLTSPAAGVLFDPTTEILATFSGPADLAAYQIWVTDGSDRTSIRYDSGKIKADDPADIDYQLPLRYNDDLLLGTKIFHDDGNYQIHIRAWDTLNRQAMPGAPAHVDLWATVHFEDDGSVDQVTSLTAAQVGATPFVRLTWVDSAAPDAYIVSRDDGQIARLDPADVATLVSSTYSWEDTAATPAIEHTYKVRRLTEGTGRSAAKSATVTINPEGIWILRGNGDQVIIDDVGIDQLQILERRLNYTPTNLQFGVDILTGYEGISGPVTGSIEDAGDQTVANAKQVLDAIKRNSTEVVQFIAASISKPVQVGNITVLPDVDYRGDMNRHRVSFTIKQVGDFDYTLESGVGDVSAGVGIG